MSYARDVCERPRHLMIVKVQIPLSSNEPEPTALVYDQSRKYEVFMPVTDELKKQMSGLPKKYFYAYYDKDRNNM
jgi:hypothetical protein